MDQKSQKMEFDGTHVHSLHRFVKHPEYLKEGQRLVFREGRTKAVGNVNKVAATKCNQKCEMLDHNTDVSAFPRS